MERLNIYYMHSNKFNYDKVYKKILESTLCVTQNFILPYSNSHKNKYAKDLIMNADLVIVELFNPSFGLILELKWLSKIKDKKILVLSLDNKIPKNCKKYIDKISIHDNDNTYIKLIEDFIREELEVRSKIIGDIHILGDLN